MTGHSALNNPPNARAIRSNQNGGRLVYVDALTLGFTRYNGEVIEVGNELVPIPSGGGITLDVAANTIDTQGNDSGFPPAMSTMYGVFLSNSMAADPALASSIRLCSGDFGTRGDSGQAYLAGGVDDGANWRCIGNCYLDAAGNFNDTDLLRHVANIDNLLPRRIRLTPGYVDDNAQTNVVFASANFGALVGGAATFVTRSEHVLMAHAVFVIVAGTAAAVSQWGIAINGTDPDVAVQVAAAAANVTASCALVTGTLASSPFTASALNTVRLVARTGAGATFAADLVRGGAAADPIGTCLVAWILG